MKPRFGSDMPGDVRLDRLPCLAVPPAITPSRRDNGVPARRRGADVHGGQHAGGAGDGGDRCRAAPVAAPSAGRRTAGSPARRPRRRPRERAHFDPLVGSVLADRYQVVRRIGEGGMGAVYEARHTVIGKRVAVKVLLEKFLAKSDFVARLLQEARLRQLDRPRAHRRRHRLRHDQRRALVRRHGVPRRRVAGRAGDPRGAAAHRAQPAHRAPGGERAGRRARQGHRPPRRQAREHLPGPARRRRLRQGRRLRHLEGGASRAGDEGAEGTG